MVWLTVLVGPPGLLIVITRSLRLYFARRFPMMNDAERKVQASFRISLLRLSSFKKGKLTGTVDLQPAPDPLWE